MQGQKTTDQISFLLPQIDESINDRLSRLERLVLAQPKDDQTQTTLTHIQGQDATTPVNYQQGGDSRQPAAVHVSGIDLATERHSLGPQQLAKGSSPLLSQFSCSCSYKKLRNQPDSQRLDILEHEQGCPISFLNKRGRTITGEIRVFSTLFRWKVSVRYSRLFLGDLQVQPNLTATAIHRNSPAFQLINSLAYINWNMEEEKVEAKLSAIIVGLRQLFMNHRAWPTDISELGENLLHVSQI